MANNIFLLLTVATGATAFMNNLGNMQIKNLELFKCTTFEDDPVSVEDVKVQIGNNNKFLLSGILNTTIDLLSPIKIEIVMKKKFGPIWIKVPCENEIGSCTFEDACTFGYPSNKECPSDFIKYKIPCRCPITKGIYTLPPTFEFKDTASVLNGKYKGNILVYMQNILISCYNTNFTLYSA